MRKRVKYMYVHNNSDSVIAVINSHTKVQLHKYDVYVWVVATIFLVQNRYTHVQSMRLPNVALTGIIRTVCPPFLNLGNTILERSDPSFFLAKARMEFSLKWSAASQSLQYKIRLHSKCILYMKIKYKYFIIKDCCLTLYSDVMSSTIWHVAVSVCLRCMYAIIMVFMRESMYYTNLHNIPR